MPSKGLWAKWPDTGSRAGGCHKTVFLGDSRDPSLTYRGANVLFEMASGGESTGLQTRVPHLPLMQPKGWGAAPAGERADVAAAAATTPPGRMEGESEKKKGWDLGTRAVSLGRREQVVACLSAQLFCISEPECRSLGPEQLGGEKAVQPGALVVFCLSYRS